MRRVRTMAEPGRGAAAVSLPARPWNFRGEYVDGDGYVRVHAPEHPRANGRGYVGKHVLVAEQTLGRLLEADERVVWQDGNRRNNEPANLVVLRRRAR